MIRHTFLKSFLQVIAFSFVSYEVSGQKIRLSPNDPVVAPTPTLSTTSDSKVLATRTTQQPEDQGSVRPEISILSTLGFDLVNYEYEQVDEVWKPTLRHSSVYRLKLQSEARDSHPIAAHGNLREDLGRQTTFYEASSPVNMPVIGGAQIHQSSLVARWGGAPVPGGLSA